jgi:hypothetical protein
MKTAGEEEGSEESQDESGKHEPECAPVFDADETQEARLRIPDEPVSSNEDTEVDDETYQADDAVDNHKHENDCWLLHENREQEGDQTCRAKCSE